jgi:GDP-L-fucose synthase
MYPARPKLPTEESLIWQGSPEITNEPYAIAKRMLVTQANAYKEQYGFSSAVAILGNQYGPNDNFHLEDGHLIPSLIRKFVEAKQKNTPVVLWGTGNITRDFIYSEDTAVILSKIMESDFCGAVNVGSGMEITLKQVTDIIREAINFENEIIFDSSKPDGEPRKYLDLTLLNSIIQMPELVSLKQGIHKTIDWFIANQNNYRSIKK